MQKRIQPAACLPPQLKTHINQVNTYFLHKTITTDKSKLSAQQQNTALVPPEGKQAASGFCPGSLLIHSPIYINILVQIGSTHFM